MQVGILLLIVAILHVIRVTSINTTAGKNVTELSRGKRRNADRGATLTLETLVILDSAYIAKLRANGATDETIPRIMMMKWNGVQAEFTRMDQLGYKVFIDIKKLLLWETEPDWYKTSAGNGNLFTTLRSFCRGMHYRNLYPEYDLIYLFSGVYGHAQAVSNIGDACVHGSNCGVTADYELNNFFNTAHEIGHTLGSNEDHLLGCGNGQGIMGTEPFGWSNCTNYLLNAFLGQERSKCLVEDNVSEDEFPWIQAAWPGMLYTPDELCEFKHGPGYRYRSFIDAYTCGSHGCANMNTSSPHYGVIHTQWSPIEGLHCGHRMSCTKKARNSYYACLSWDEIGLDESLFMVSPGGWSDWGPMSECSRTCGTGVKYRQRFCNNPKPLNSPNCEGEEVEAEVCNTQPCPDDPASESELIKQRAREVCKQKKEKGLWQIVGLKSDDFFDTGDRFSHNRIGQCEINCDRKEGVKVGRYRHYGIIPDGTPCITDTASFSDRHKTVRRPGYHGHCVQGYCVQFDGVGLSSGNTVIDGCGVLGGTNSTCKVVEGTYTGQLNRGFTRTLIVTVPARAYRIQADYDFSKMPTTYLELNAKSGSTIIAYPVGSLPFTRNIAGADWYYNGNILQTDGPLDRRINIMFFNYFGRGNSGINFGYSLPLDFAGCTGTCENGGTWNSEFCDCDCTGGWKGPLCTER